MRIGAAVLARLSSSRLPGKVLHEAGGRPLVGWALARLARVEGLDAIVLATSEEPSDEPLRAWAREQGVAVHAGPLEDVLARIIGAAEEHGLDAVARVNADSPWLDPGLLDEAVALMRARAPDLVSNLVEREWPYGISAEVASLEALRRLHAGASAEERTHATAGFYARQGEFSILSLRSRRDLSSDVRLTVDTPADLARFERMLGLVGVEGAAEAALDRVIEAALVTEREATMPPDR